MESKWGKNILLGTVMIFLLFLTACNQASETTSSGETNESIDDESEKLTVYTSFYPLYDFAGKIAGNRVKVINLVPPGAESHDFEPTPKDVVRLSEADLFIYNGIGYEMWIEDVLDSLDTSKITVLNMSEHVDLLTREKTGGVSEEEGHSSEQIGESEESHEEEQASEHEEDNYDEGIYDPHIWLDPLRAKDMAAAIKDALIQIDSEGKETYEANYEKLAVEFDQLHEEYQQAVAGAERKEIIVSHAAFGYMANRYGLEQIAISGLSPSDEPTQKELQEIITFAKENNVQYILFETLVTSKMANVVKEQIGAEALMLNPLEGLTEEELADDKDYFFVMRDNLNSLKKAIGSES